MEAISHVSGLLLSRVHLTGFCFVSAGPLYTSLGLELHTCREGRREGKRWREGEKEREREGMKEGKTDIKRQRKIYKKTESETYQRETYIKRHSGMSICYRQRERERELQRAT